MAKRTRGGKRSSINYTEDEKSYIESEMSFLDKPGKSSNYLMTHKAYGYHPETEKLDSPYTNFKDTSFDGYSKATYEENLSALKARKERIQKILNSTDEKKIEKEMNAAIERGMQQYRNRADAIKKYNEIDDNTHNWIKSEREARSNAYSRKMEVLDDTKTMRFLHFNEAKIYKARLNILRGKDTIPTRRFGNK